jgi:hypothetical protein
MSFTCLEHYGISRGFRIMVVGGLLLLFIVFCLFWRLYVPNPDIEHIFFIYTIISYHLPKKRYNIIYIISWKEWYDRISYIIFLSFQKKLKFYILFINNQSSKHTKRRSPLSLIIFYSDNGHKLTSKRAVKSTQASNLWRGNLKLGQKLKMT